MLPGDQLQDAEPRRVTLSRSQRKLIGWGILAAVALVIIVIFLLTRLLSQPGTTVSTAVPPTSSTTAPAEPAATSPQSATAPDSAAQVVDLAALTQPERKAFVLRLINQGVFTGVQATESPPKVGVTPLFQALNLDLKRQFIAAVEAYVHNGAATTQALEIIDATNGKSIGTFTVADGLKLQE